MHYLEDDLELLEILPSELRKHYLAVRSLDAQFEAKMAQLRGDQKELLRIYDTLSPDERTKRKGDISKMYAEIRDLGEQKLAINEYIQLSLEKYQDRVSKDLSEFKYELELDVPGITDGIEKDFLETIAKERQLAEGHTLTIDMDDSDVEGLRTPMTMASSGTPSTSMSRVNGHLLAADRASSHSSVLATPRSHHHSHLGQFPAQKQPQSFDEFRLPTTSQSRLHQQTPTDMLQSSRGSSFDDDIFDSEVSTPPAKRKAPPASPLQRQLSLKGPEKSVSPSEGAFFAQPFPPHMAQSQQQMRGVARQPLMKMPSFGGTRASLHGRPRKSSVSVSPSPAVPSSSIFPRVTVSPGALLKSTVTTRSSLSMSSSDPAQNHRKKSSQKPSKATQSLQNLVMPVMPTAYVCLDQSNSTTNFDLADLQKLLAMNNKVPKNLKSPATIPALTKRVEQMLAGGVEGGEPSTSQQMPSTERRSVGRPPSSALALAHGYGSGATPTTARKRRPKKRPDFYEEEGEEIQLEDEEGDVEEEDEEAEYEGEMEDEGEASGEEEDNEDNRTWCICKQKSHGNMVACDNKQCKLEWFHYACVGITAPPKGKWYCRTCATEMAMRRSQSRE